MIVRPESDGTLVLIPQNDHAQVAATFAAHWGNAEFARPARRDSMIRAALLHDFSWIEEETKPWFDAATGSPMHYIKVPSELQLDANQWTNDWVTGMDPYAGLMVAKHRTGIWKARYGLMAKPHYAERALPDAVEAFIARSHAAQAAIAAAFDPGEITANYLLLQLWDLFSLYICTNQVLEPLEIDNGARMRLTPDGHRIAIDPYPFDQPALTVQVRHRRLPQTSFASAASFHDAYFRQPQEMLRYTFVDGQA